MYRIEYCTDGKEWFEQPHARGWSFSGAIRKIGDDLQSYLFLEWLKSTKPIEARIIDSDDNIVLRLSITPTKGASIE